jgi:hypothetical protein
MELPSIPWVSHYETIPEVAVKLSYLEFTEKSCMFTYISSVPALVPANASNAARLRHAEAASLHLALIDERPIFGAMFPHFFKGTDKY